MGNTDIVTAPLSDANEKNTTEHSTIFDDVFRTIAQKMPQLLIPLINEVFHTSYSDEDSFTVETEFERRFSPVKIALAAFITGCVAGIVLTFKIKKQ
jgi:hypothetical protein